MSGIDTDEKLNSSTKSFSPHLQQWILGPESLWDCCNLPVPLIMMSWGGDGPQGENFPILIRARPIVYPWFKKTSFILYKLRFSIVSLYFLKGLFKRNKLLIIEILQANQISTFPTEQVINWFGFQIEGHPVIDFRGNKKQEHLVKMLCQWDQGMPRVLPWVLLISVSCQSQKPSRREPSL